MPKKVPIPVSLISLTVIGDVLHYICKTDGRTKRVILDLEEAKELLYVHHSSDGHGSHSGINNSQYKLNLHYYWRGMYEDTAEFVSYSSFITSRSMSALNLKKSWSNILYYF